MYVFLIITFCITAVAYNDIALVLVVGTGFTWHTHLAHPRKRNLSPPYPLPLKTENSIIF